jgi:hypothetical protein
MEAIPTNLKSKWQFIQYKRMRRLNEAIEEMHHAAQFIAMAGNSYLKHEADDSHTNMVWSHKHKGLFGKWIIGNQTFRLGLITKDFDLSIEDENEEIISGINLSGYTPDIIENWLKIKLKDLGLDPEKLNLKRHYQIPDYKLDHGMPYGFITKGILKEITKYRFNSDLILNALGDRFEYASSVNTWPHHFDTGIYIPLEKNKKGEVIRSFSAGWAIADEFINEPYYYITYWPNESIDKKNLPALQSKGFWQTKYFFGLILPISLINHEQNTEDQFDIVKAYFDEGVSFIDRFV